MPHSRPSLLCPTGSSTLLGALLPLGLTCLGLAACAPSGEGPQEGASDAVEASAQDTLERRNRFLVQPGQLMEELNRVAEASGTPLRVLEVGPDPEAFLEEGHVKDARFLPWSAVAQRRDDLPNQIPPLAGLAEVLRELGVGEETRLVLYDRGVGLRAGRAWAVLDYAGLGERTRILDGQWAGWEAAGGEVSAGEPPPVGAGDVTLRPHPERVLDGARLADLIWAQTDQSPALEDRLHWLDARPPEEYSGQVPGDEVVRPGHIPEATNLYWRTLVGPDETPFFLEDAELRAAFQEADALEGTPLVTYCRTGGQAGHLYFVARMLGYDVRLYDGSFVDWSRNLERPVVQGL